MQAVSSARARHGLAQAGHWAGELVKIAIPLDQAPLGNQVTDSHHDLVDRSAEFGSELYGIENGACECVVALTFRILGPWPVTVWLSKEGYSLE